MQHGRNLLSLFGYINGLKFSQNYGAHIPPFFIQAPIIIVPKLTQQQSVILLPASTDEHFQELNHAVNPVKLSKYTNKDDVKTEKNEINNEILHEEDKINKIIKEESHGNIKRDISSKNRTDSISNKISVRQSNFTSNSTVMTISTINKDSNTSVNVPEVTNTNVTTENIYNETTTQSTTNNTTQTPVSTVPSGVYPLAKYNNSFISDIIFTTPSTYVLEGVHNANMLPRDDEKWRNFSSKSGNIYPSFEGFKPLTGLYYDGFLHKMLIKEKGWSPLLN